MTREEEGALGVGEVKKETTPARRLGESASTASSHKEQLKEEPTVGSLKKEKNCYDCGW